MACRLSCSVTCGNLPRPGLEPVSPALVGGFLTTVSSGKSLLTILIESFRSRGLGGDFCVGLYYSCYSHGHPCCP